MPNYIGSSTAAAAASPLTADVFERMRFAQNQEWEATAAYLRPLFDAVIELRHYVESDNDAPIYNHRSNNENDEDGGMSYGNGHGKTGRGRGKIIISDDPNILTYADCARAVAVQNQTNSMNINMSKNMNVKNSSKSSNAFMADEQFAMILSTFAEEIPFIQRDRENYNDRHDDNNMNNSMSNTNNYNNNDRIDLELDGITFVECLSCYRVVLTGMLSLKNMPRGSAEREKMKERIVGVVRTFLPNCPPSQDDFMSVKDMKDVFTAKDWQLAQLIDEHANEIDQIADLILKGKTSYRWTSMFRMAVLVLVGISGYAYRKYPYVLVLDGSNTLSSPPLSNLEDGDITNVSSTMSGRPDPVIFETACSDVKLPLCEKDVSSCQAQLATVEKLRREDMQLISHMNDSQTEFNKMTIQLRSSYEETQNKLIDLSEKHVEALNKVARLELESSENIRAGEEELHGFKQVEGEIRDLREKNIFLNGQSQRAEISLKSCQDKLKYIDVEMDRIKSMSKSNAESLRMCLSRVDENHLEGRVPTVVQVPKRKLLSSLRKFVPFLTGSLFAVFFPVLWKSVLKSFGGTAVATAARGTRVGKRTRMAKKIVKKGGLFSFFEGFLSSFSGNISKFVSSILGI